jgi:hypothetical protein
MELEELKTNWFVLNERLAKNEILNKRIIKEMITKRTRTACNQLMGYYLLGLILVLGGALWIGFSFVLLKGHMPLSFMIIGETGLLLTLIWQLIKVMILNGFRFDSETVYALSVKTLKFKLLQKREFIVGIIAVPILTGALFCFVPNYSVGTKILLFLFITVVGVVLSYALYLYVEKRNIEVIEKGLEELNELEAQEKLEKSN